MYEITAGRAKSSHNPMAHPITTYGSTFMTLAYPRTLQQFYHHCLQN
jgi:hypothetical protein